MTSWYRFPRSQQGMVGMMPGLTPGGRPIDWMKQQKGKGKKVDVIMVSPTAAEDARQRELAKRNKNKNPRTLRKEKCSIINPMYQVLET